MQLAVWTGSLESVDVVYTVDWYDKKVFQAQVGANPAGNAGAPEPGKGTVSETGGGQFDEKQYNTEVINSDYNQESESWYNEDKKDPSERGVRGSSGISQHAEGRW